MNFQNKTQLVLVFSILILSILQSSCNKENNNVNINGQLVTGTVTDTDGNIYKTIKIGNQWWMAENLKVRHYRNGDSITNLDTIIGQSLKLNSQKWKAELSGGYSIKSSTNASNGYLYNFYAIADTRNIAPEGWRVPSDEDWKELEIFLGMEKSVAEKVNWRGTNQGNKLKIQNYSGVSGFAWKNPIGENAEAIDVVTNPKYEIWGTNESGFCALPAYYVMFDGTLANDAQTCCFLWTSSSQGNGGWYRYLDYNKINVFRYYGPASYGFCIRCVRDVVENENN